jgi:hypothetical protein
MKTICRLRMTCKEICVALLGVDLGQSLICLALRSFYFITAIPLVSCCCSSPAPRLLYFYVSEPFRYCICLMLFGMFCIEVSGPLVVN